MEGNMSDGGRKDAIISSEAWRASASLGSCRAALRRSPTGRGQGQKHMRGTQNDKYAHQKRSLEEAEGVYEQGSEEGLCFTSVGLKQSTSKSYKTGKNRMK